MKRLEAKATRDRDGRGARVDAVPVRRPPLTVKITRIPDAADASPFRFTFSLELPAHSRKIEPTMTAFGEFLAATLTAKERKQVLDELHEAWDRAKGASS